MAGPRLSNPQLRNIDPQNFLPAYVPAITAKSIGSCCPSQKTITENSGNTLRGLLDVDFLALLQNNLIAYDASSAKWKNKTLAEAGIAAATHTHNVSDIVGGSSVSGTNNRITANSGVIDISASYVGQTSLTTLGTVTVGTWQGTAIADAYVASSATWNSKESALTFSTGLTRSVNAVTVNTTQNIIKLSNLTSNGFIKTSNADGTLSIDTATYLTSNQTITLSGEISGSGTTGISGTLSNSAVIGKVLTGFTSGAGTVAATDSILQAIQKLNGNVAAIPAVSGTSNRVTVSSGVVDISASYVGQNTITTVGTIGTGTWSATAIGETKGGTGQTTYTTGDLIYASAANTLAKLAGNGTATRQALTMISGSPAWATFTAANLNDSSTIAFNNVANAFSIGQSIVGSTDIVQLSVKGNATQTSNVVEVRTSANVLLAAINNTGALSMKSSVWHLDTDGNSRIYMQTSGPTYVRGFGSGAAFLVRNASDSDLYQVNHDGTMIVNNTTASTGVSKLVVKAGAGQSTTNLAEWQSSAGTALTAITATGEIDMGTSVTAQKLWLYKSGTTRYGMGIASGQLNFFAPTGGIVTFGQMSTSDGTTLTQVVTFDMANKRFGVGTTTPTCATSLLDLNNLATATVGTGGCVEVLNLGRNTQGGVSWSQIASFYVGRFQTATSSSPDTRLELKLKHDSNSTLAGNVVAGVWCSDGRSISVVPNSAIADATLGNSQMSFYLDAGETNLTVKVKTSAGTVKTATIAVA